jgi:hypothetical protein
MLLIFRTMVALLGITAALFLGLTGIFISFVPGLDAVWFGFAAAMAALGLLARRWKTRLFAAALFCTLAWFAYAGFMHGVEYLE